MKSKWVSVLIGAIISFLIPWVLLFYSYFTCVGAGCGDYGLALPAIILFSLLSLSIGALIGYVLNIKNIQMKLLTLAGFSLPWIYFIFIYIQNASLPRLQQKSLTYLFFIILFLSLIILGLGIILTKIIQNKRKEK